VVVGVDDVLPLLFLALSACAADGRVEVHVREGEGVECCEDCLDAKGTLPSAMSFWACILMKAADISLSLMESNQTSKTKSTKRKKRSQT
jgi:hypothetical protein